MLRAPSNFERWAAKMPDKIAKQARYAGMQTLNDCANEIKAELVRDVGYSFNAPTPWTMRAPAVRYAQRGGPLVADVFVNGASLNGRTFTNKTGRAQINTLRPHMQGGRRELKAFEKAFQRVGLMPKGWFAVPGSGAFSLGAMDGYGNIKASYIVMLISYFQAFGEVGYRANATDKSRARRANMGKSENGYSTIRGIAFFISRGRGQWFGNGSWRQGRRQHLAPGIWAKTGIHGSDIKPVIIFVSAASYRQRISLPLHATRIMHTRFQPIFARRFADAMATAR